MSRYLLSLSAGLLLIAASCDRAGTAGGPGTVASNPEKTTLLAPADNTFTIDVPLLSTKMKQGEAKSVTLAINRGKNFQEDVVLKFDTLPRGVTVDNPSPMIKHGDANVKVNLKAADDAALGDFTVKVSGQPTMGAVAANDLKVTVEKK